ncbi:MAG: HlyD family efflux transporter periplasmic adaptor subunit [Gemmataceae bacterium]|nr:HlyD family efflux transporter periplasmic adaptor subunit [Gemmataceae bacterium]
MNTNVDLRALAVRRDEAPAAATMRRSWRLGTRIVLPGVVLLGFLAVVGWAARDRLLPARPVTVVPVHTTYLDVQNEGTPIFQAAGWIEPRPTPILVTALTEGVVEKLLVVEGQKLKVGDQVAQLIQQDARLALQTAEADRELRQADVEHAKAVLAAARWALPFQLKAARSRLALAQASYDAKKRAIDMGAIPPLTFQQAESEVDSAASVVAELEFRLGKRKTDEIGPHPEAAARVKAAVAHLKQAEIAVASAQLRLERTIIKAPSTGQVLALVARPGQHLMGQVTIGHPEASTIITMFDPAMIQVRADVRLDDVPKVQPGQRVTIDTPVTPDRPLEGEVLQITSQADIQKNTLQVKVAIKSPPPTLRPDMLVQVTFLALPAREVVGGEKQSLRLLIQKQLVESADGSTHVWIADLAGKIARRQPVKLGRSSGEFVEVVQGLNPADRLITDGRQGLGDGQRIAVTHAENAAESLRPDGGTRPKRLPNPAGKQDHSGKH